MEMIGSNTTAIAKVSDTCRSIDVRRSLAGDNELISKLCPVDRDIFMASIKTSIAELSDQELVYKLATVADVIRRDIGIKSIDDYDVTRFIEILKTYYSYMTLAEIKLAFELSMTGELNDYLPVDRYGRPDNNHYQSFSVSYVTKVLNAYKAKRNDVEAKAYTYLPVKEKKVSSEEKAIYARHSANVCMMAYLRYKYRGELELTEIQELIVYRELEKSGLAFDWVITQSDRKQAVSSLIQKSQKGLINQFVGECIRRQQTKHKDVDAEAMIIARRRALRFTFDYMVKEEIQLNLYIWKI